MFKKNHFGILFYKQIKTQKTKTAQITQNNNKNIKTTIIGSFFQILVISSLLSNISAKQLCKISPWIFALLEEFIHL